jgi:hypothetical protein
MYYQKGMEIRLRKGDVGEAIFRNWFERKLGDLARSRRITIEQQGFNPGGFLDISEKGHLKQKNDPDFAIYPEKSEKPLVGISINTQAKLYTVDSSMGKGCIKCPRAYSCYDGFEGNLWYNEYNLSDYYKFEHRFNVETCMVTLLVNAASIAKWVEDNKMEHLIYAYILDGGQHLTSKEKEALADLLKYLRQGRRKNWERPLQIRWLLRSELDEITPMKSSVDAGKIRYWTTGGRVERGRPRPICCVDSKLARNEGQLIQFLTNLAEQA